MDSLKKSRVIPIRFSPDEYRRAKKAARIVSKNRGEVVGVSTLLRAHALRGVDLILEPPTTPLPFTTRSDPAF